MSLLGIDIGTTGCKAAAFSESGGCLASAYREYTALRPREGWAELDSRHVWAQVRETIRHVAALSGNNPITALSTSSMGEAVTPVSRGREILGTCILSSDLRGAEFIEDLRQRISQFEHYSINPNLLGPSTRCPSSSGFESTKRICIARQTSSCSGVTWSHSCSGAIRSRASPTPTARSCSTCAAKTGRTACYR